ncbi:hypothetical protein [Actinoplanes friuliensis]|uniref:Uncharacterized protein n=1 Tax=Actinoplanes friuliensis DSM 7358 TaxID=1246995 RepID=U5W979_9ACTN|nr:hypothetical protein [Actinoplanes friuliensis]AGZ45557.1 hypothetical protein AFR_36505 [Actinoplanes friuliensis DSM 7358]
MTDLAQRTTRRAPSLAATLLLRCALYLGPLSVAVAGVRPLGATPWQVSIGTLILGWSAAQALAGAGTTVARRRGSSAGARVVGAGFAAATVLWSALILLAPAELTGTDRATALAVGIGGLATLATVTAALVTHTEAAVIRWSLPCWLLAAVSLAGSLGDTLADRVPVLLLLPIAIAAAATRAFRPALGRTATVGLCAADLRGTAGRLLLGAGQAGCAALLWRAGPPAATSPAVLPLLAAAPVLEALIGWHRRQVQAGLDVAESDEEFREHVGGVTLVTVAALLPPLAAGLALSLGAYQLPGGIEGAREVVLALAGGILLSGVLAITLLLAAHGRTAVAALLAVAPPLAAVATPLVPVLPPDPLPTVVAILAATHLVGLLTVAQTAADPRRTP